MNQNIKNTLLHLSLIPDIGPATVEKIVEAIGLENLINLYKSNFNDRLLPLSKNIIQKIINGLADLKLLNQELDLINANNINWITLYDKDYPELLKRIYLPPVVLYIKGQDLSNFKNNIAIVGSRKADSYGFKVVNQLVPQISQLGFDIVSGGALGIDTAVHQATVNAKGGTIAVLGSGLLKLYPSSNNKLFDSIINNNGAIISPFPLLTTAKPENFPARNRIISGLSRATIVIQAANPSGALITASYALDQGREVGAVPGAIDNALSAGCHKLISDGAAIITNINDVKSMLGITIEINKKVEIGDNVSIENSINLDFITQDNVQIDNVKSQISLQSSHIQTSCDFKNQIINNLNEPMTIDSLIDKINLPISVLQETLFSLQLEGIIDQNFMGLWHLV